VVSPAVSYAGLETRFDAGETLTDDTQERAISLGRRKASSLYGRSAWLALIAATLGIALAGCGGSESPSVASIAPTSTQTAVTAASSGSGGSTSAGSKGNATGYLVEWAACMRSHGDPDQTPPTVDIHYGINVTIPPGAPESLSNEVHGGTAPCNQYLADASNALEAEHPAPPPPSQDATGVKYAACMRAHGVPNYPDPTGTETNLRGIDMSSPFFIRANKLCGKQIGAPAWWINGWGPPGNISVSNFPPGCVPSGNSTTPPPGCLPPGAPPSNSGTTTTPSSSHHGDSTTRRT
jgi:hypothetical protein